MHSLYIHFPFCETKCHYCDFYSLGRQRTRDDDHDTYEKALHTEISQTSHLLSLELDTLFFGGGTPSMTSYDSMARALEPLWKKTRITSNTEWTMEANPSSITLKALQAYRSYGINRISIGIQALRPDLLQLLGRVHSRETAIEAIETAGNAGFEDISVDLLCGVPNQALSDLEDALRILTRFPITHLSCYLLTLPPHHKLYKALPQEDTQLEHLLFVHDWLTRNGFEHYEISNFAKPKKRARHNLNYWKGHSYLGLGPSAHSYDSGNHRRWKNISSLHQYAKRLSQGESVIEWTETLTPAQRELEKWMLALRLDDGFPLEWLTSPHQRDRTQLLEVKGLLEVHPQNPILRRLTPKGFALSDQVISMLA